MSTIRKLFVAALVALPIAALGVASAEAGSRNHGGNGGYSSYGNHGGYNNHNRGYARRDHVRPRKAWFGRMHSSRRHRGGWSNRH